jgi:hypothetical protein
MRRRHKVDIVRAFRLKAHHLGGKLICSQSPGAALTKLLADLVILAKHTAKVAAGEKDGP